MGWFITQSLLFIIVTAVIFFAIGLWVGWILWSRRTPGKHTAEATEKKAAAATGAAATDDASDAPGAPEADAGTDTDTEATATDAPSVDAGAPATTHAAPSDGTDTETAAEDAAPGTDSEATSEPSDIEDENLAVFAGAEAEVVAEAEAATRVAVVDSPEDGSGDDDTGTDADGTDAPPHDDLTRIEGIGPKIADALKAGGYGSYATIAEASEADLRKALTDAGITFAPAASSFSAQCQYLVDGDDEGLEEYQDYLIAGRDRKSSGFVEDVDYTDVDELDGADAKQAALAADAEKVAETTGEEDAADAAALTADAEAATGDTAEDVAVAPETPADEDLKVVEGIGPKIEAALKNDGITSYAQIAASSEAELRASIRKGGIKFAPSIKSWAQQAQYLVDGDDDGLQEYQDYLIGGQDRGTTKFVEHVDYTDVDELDGESAKEAALAADARKVSEAEGEKA
ncbi:hypothetical protein GCM10028784_02700 [Myceligenerans cantabricum]